MRSSCRMRVTTMRCSAALACLSPPRLSRRRWLFPEDFSTGLTPHRAAKDASLPSRSGLSPAVISRAAALSGPIPSCSSRLGAVARIRYGHPPFELGGFLPKLHDALCEQPQREDRLVGSRVAPAGVGQFCTPAEQ